MLRSTPLLVAALSLAACSVRAPTYRLDPRFPVTTETWGEVSWVTFDPATRQLLVLQRSNPPVVFLSPAGQEVGQWTTTALGFPHSLRLRPEAGGTPSVWITDMAPPLLAGTGFGHCVKRFTFTSEPAGTIGTCGENSQGSGLAPVQFDKVTDIGFGSADRPFFITDGDLGGLNNRTLTLDAEQKVLADWSAPGNQPGGGPKQFNLPHALEVDDCARVWIVDTLNNRVQVVSESGEFLGELACFGQTQTHDVELVRLSPTTTRLWVSTGLPTPSSQSGSVILFDLPSACDQLALDCKYQIGAFSVPLPTTATEAAMVHAITVDPLTQDIYLALLGGNLPPQKWVAGGGS